ncbi:uncharacterized protein LOC128553784 [Mercenaria mercenaria]|uniref:uncharacterized protein LOC128553784 n=1 Tax=Mercenaria mercenaria TaxID=6596 RepID=UPI00234EF91A|nr:uncharacterized protein LOC128553784 [Mercenaria mercenaria]
MYEKALKDGVEKDRSIRVNIVGNYKQGKTSLTKRLLGNKVRRIKSTNGVDIEHYTCFKTDAGKLKYRKAEYHISDIAERLASAALNSELSTSTLVGSQCKQQTTFYMSTDIQRFEHCASDKDTKRKQICSDTQLTAVLSEKEIDTFTKALNRKASPSKENIATVFDIWDFGGQYVFYATHTIFHSKRAIYLLVFDLSSNLKSVVIDKDFPAESNDRNMEYFLQFWMQSIHSFVGSEDGTEPKVILVGTHKDKIKGSTERKKRYIEKYFDDVRKLFDGTKMLKCLYHEDFAIDNTDSKDASITALRETICTLGNEEKNMLEIPTKWIQLEKSLKERKHIEILSLEWVMAIDRENDYPLGDLEQVKLFLKYHHEKGTFIYFDEEPISEYVVLDPQYLIDAFKKLITSERFATTDPEIRPAWKMLFTDARLEKCLVDRQWGQDGLFLEYQEILLAFLTKHLIVSEATIFNEITETSTGLGWYVVPSLLRNYPEKHDMQDFLLGKEQTHIRLIISFKYSHIVQTIYHRFIAALIAKWSIVKTSRKTLIFTNLCVVRLDRNHAGIAEMKLSGIELTVVNLCPSLQVEGGKADIFRRYSEAVIIHEFKRLRDKKENSPPYTLMCRCNHRSHGMKGSVNIATIEELNNEKLVPCLDLSDHALDADKAKSEWFQDCRKPISVPNVYLNDKLLGKLSHCIGENWQLLGYELGLTRVQLEHITEDHTNSTLMKIYYMLNTWCRQMPATATLENLVRAMQNCQALSVEWDELRNIVDGIV